MSAPDRAAGSIQNATRAGQKLDISTPIHNLDPVARTGAAFTITVDAWHKNKSVPPTIWWRIDKGAWHLVRFTWKAGQAGSDATWQSPDLWLGTFAAHQTRTLVTSTSFSSGSTKGLYSGWEVFGTAACDKIGSSMQGFSAFALTYKA